MSVFITKPISGIKIEGLDYDLRPHEPLAGTYEVPTTMNYEVKIDNAPDCKQIPDVKPKGKPISGRVWAEPEAKTSTKRTKHKPDQKELNYRQARSLQVRDFVKTRKEEINRKILQAKKQRVETKKRKEANVVKGNTYQIKDTSKLKKWSKKARKQLMKMPKDMFENYLKTQKQQHDEQNRL